MKPLFHRSTRSFRSPWAALALFVAIFPGITLPRPARSAEAEKPAPASEKRAGLAIADLKRESPVDFETEILPAFKNNCLACHNTTKAKGGLNLETPKLILQGGDSGPGLVPGKGADSLVFKASAHLDPELIMPPKDNKANAANLAPEQLALLKLWIDQGGKGEVRSVTPVNWIDKPPTLDSIFSVAMTRDGQFGACGRGNSIDVYHLPSNRRMARLRDPGLATGSNSVSHRDYVNTLAFNPEGTLLASGAYREVKIWRRPVNVQKTPIVLSNECRTFALSADGHWLATDAPSHGIALYSLREARPFRILAGHSNALTALSFSPDGAKLCSASEDRGVFFWNLTNGSQSGRIELPTQSQAMAWVNDGKVVATGGADGVIRLWNLEDFKKTLEFKGHEGVVTALAAIPGRAELLSAGADGSIKRWNTSDGQMIREAKHGGTVTALVVRPDGKRFASAGTNGLAKLWNTEDAMLAAEMKGDRHADDRVAETERTLIVAKLTTEFHKKAVETADAENKKQTERVAKATSTNTFTEKVFLEKEKAFQEAKAAKTGADKALEELLAEIKRVTTAFETADQSARKAAQLAKTVTAEATEAQLTAERASLSKNDVERIAADTASVASKARAAVNNADAAKDIARRIAEESTAVAQKSKGFADAVAADAEMKTKLAAEAKVAADKAIEQVAALSFAAGQLKPAYDKTLGEAPEKRKQATNQIAATEKTLAGAEREFKRAETRKSVTGHELELALQAAGRASNSVAVAKAGLESAETRQRQTEDNLVRYKLAARNAVVPIHALAFSPDGNTLATFGEDHKIHCWSGETGAPSEVLPASENHSVTTPTNSMPSFVAFLNAETVLAPKGSRTIAVWDLFPEWTLERTIGSGGAGSPLADRVNAARFSPDGNVLATGGGEPTRSGEIKLWDVSDGRFLREFANIHSDAVLALDFSPDGKYLASSSADRFARVVNLATGKIERAFEGHTSYVLGVAWKADSRTLASAGADNVIKIWDFVSGERRKNIDGAGKEVTSLAYVGVTDQVAASSGDNSVRLVRDNGEKVRSFDGAGDFMQAVAVTPDGEKILAGGQDGVLRVWNGKDGKLISSFPAKEGR